MILTVNEILTKKGIKMRFKDIIGKNIAVNCRTEDEANRFMKLAVENGLMWVNGETPCCVINEWNLYADKTCYSCLYKAITFSSLNNAVSSKYSIINFSELEDIRKEKNMTTLEMMNAAEGTNNVYVAEDMRYSKEKGFHDRNGREWNAGTFDTIDEIFQINSWHLLPKITINEIEKQLGYEFELISE